MGGKHKQAHRTKNNARPSSSGRSAELLASSSNFSPFSVPFKPGASFSLAPPFGESLDIDTSVDSSFQLALKKMGKKDATTRLKGLQEFSEAVKSVENDVTEIRAVLAAWLRQYETLVTDSEHRVREAANLTHREVVKKVGKWIAPFLKQIAGAWFTSQYDTYAPAASAALLSFEDAFPPAKQRDAIVFCQEEILAYIRTNIIVQSPQTLTHNKAVLSAEDAAAKYERVVVSSLLGYRLYLDRVTSPSHPPATSTIPHHVALLTHVRFWQLAKHKSPSVRRAWFGLMGAMCHRAPSLLSLSADLDVGDCDSVTGAAASGEQTGDGVAKKQQKGVSTVVGVRLVQSVFGQLDDGEPTVMMPVWETMLLTVTTVQDFWKYISIEKLMLPKLFKVLREGGMGNASTVYPSVLPLILHLPPTLNAETFYPPLFDNIRQGLRHRTVLASRSESTSTSLAFVECLRFAIKSQHDNKALCHKLLISQLMPTMEWCLRDHTQNIYKTFFNQIGTFIQFLHNNKATYPNFCLYLDTFWSNCTSLFEGLLIESDAESAILLVTKQSELLQSLKSVNNKAKKQLKVKFDTSDGQCSLNSSSSDSDNQTAIVDRGYMDRIDSLVYNNCECIVLYIKDKHCKGLLEQLHALLQDFCNEGFMKKLGKGSLMGLYTNLFQKWLKSSYLCSKPVVSMIFLMFKYLTDDEKTVILEGFMNVETQDCIGWCICRAMSHPYHCDNQIQEWLKNDKVGSFLLHILELEMEDTSTPDLSLLLKKAFQENSDNNLLLSSSTVQQIMSKLSECLQTPARYAVTIDTCASLAAYIASVVYTETALISHGDHLLLAMFELSCNTEVDEESLSDDTRWEIATAWQDAITLLSASLPKEELLQLTVKFANVLYEANDSKPSDIAEKVVSFAKAVAKGNTNLVGAVLDIILHQNTPVLSSMNDFEQICLISAYINGQLVRPYTKLSHVPEMSEDSLVRLFRWLEIISTVWCTTDDEEQCEELLDDDGNAVNKDMLVIELAIDCAKEFVDIVYFAKLGEAYLREFKPLQYSNKISDSCDILRSHIKTIYDKLQISHFEQIRSILLTKVEKEGFFWTHALRQLNLEIMPKMFNLYIDATSLGAFNLGQLHLVQTFAKDLVYHDVCDVKTTDFGRIVTLRSLMHCDELDVQIAEVYTAIARMKNDEKMKSVFYNIDFSNWEQAELSIEIMRMCAAFISSDKTKTMSKNHWDFIIISLAAWASRLSDVKSNYRNIQVVAFAAAVAKLFTAVAIFIKQLEEENVQSNYIDEWNDLFAENAQLEILKTWLFFTEQVQSSTTDSPHLHYHHLLLFTHYLPICCHLRDTYVFRPSDLANSNLWTQTLKRGCALLLDRRQPALQLAGHRMLVQIAAGLAAVDGAVVQDMKDVREGALVLEQLGALLAETGEVVRVMLLEFRMGEDSCRVEPYTDSYTFTLAYLLIWDILLTLCEKSSTELRYQYAHWMKEKDYLTILLNNSFKLMPLEVLHSVDGKSKPLKHYFVEKFDFPLNGSVTSERLERLVCWVFNGAVYQLPAVVRQWWADADTRTAQIVERVTRAYVSPLLCHKELTNVTSSENTFKNMVIKVHPTVREVIAVYTIDDAQMELVITLPPNYPLAGAEVDCQKQIGGTAHKLLMQLRMCIQHQNGRVWDGLMLWNTNLDKKFDGVEECYICFALIHQGTYQLPKLSCGTCKKKFHSACLYKWFSTSNKSTCPICRNLF